MIAAFAKAVAQLADPAVRGVLWIGVAIAVAVFAALWTTVGALLAGTETFSWAWIEWIFDVLGGVATVALTWLLFPGVISAATALSLERVAEAVERRHYPELGPAAGVPATAALVAALKFLAVTLGFNIALLPFLLIPPVFPFLLIRDTPLGKAYVLGTFLTREVTDMGFKVASRVRGLSDEAFREAFGAEEQCRSALSRLRWPDGFVCPACGHRGHCVLAGRSLYQCYRCKKQTSSTAGTIFHATKLPLTLWFAAVHLIVTAKNGISSVELGRRLGVKQPTAWTMKHKIMAVMARREADTPLSGRVEMDDAYLGGARAGGKRGRGAPGKTPFVAAVSTSPEGRPRKVKLVPVKGFRKREIARGAKRWLAPGSEVLTDGLRCWNALDGVVGSHRAIRTGSGRQAARMAPFKWVNTTLGNIKSAITGTYRKLGPDHAQRYLASFAWRYNWRYQLNTMIPRFVHSAARTQPIPYRALIAG